MTDSAAPPGSDALIDALSGAGRACGLVLSRWLVETGLSLRAAAILATLDPEDAPMSVSEVAHVVGLSADDAAGALHELRSGGYAREENRRYLPTDKTRRLHAELAGARREAVGTFLSGLSDEQRRALSDAASHYSRR